MAYLQKSDYTLSISINHLDEILDQASETSGLTPDNILANAESWARAFIKSYLVSKYDIAAEFAIDGVANPEDRNPLILGVLIDLSLCQLHKTINPRDIPELRDIACAQALQWLKDARDGVVVVELDPAPVEDGQVNYQRTYLSSQTKFISRPWEDSSLRSDQES